METDTPLMSAVRNRNKVEVEKILESGVDVNQDSAGVDTPLHLVDDPEILILLLKYGGDVNALGHLGNTPLLEALKDNRFSVAKILCEQPGLNIEATDADGYTALHLARDVELVDILIGRGADVDALGNEFRTPLHCASDANAVAVVKQLCEKGASIDAHDMWDSTALHLAKHIDVVDLLISHGADSNVADGCGRTALHCATEINNVSIIRHLCQQPGIQVDKADDDGYTALHFAKDAEAADALLSIGADVNICGGMMRQTPLHKASENNRVSVVKRLCQQETLQVNAADDDGYSALHTARDPEMVAALLSRGADVNACDNLMKRSPLHVHLCSESCNISVVKRLCQQPGLSVNATDSNGSTALLLAKDLEVVETLISIGADVNACDKKGHTPLYLAAKYNRGPVIKFLCQQPDLQINVTHEKHLAAIHLAKDVDAVSTLLSYGADINIQDSRGHTALHWASFNNKISVAKVLCQHPSLHIDATDESGSTALHVAGSDEMADLLVSQNADINVCDKWGRTPLHRSCEDNRVTVAEYLCKQSGIGIDAADTFGETPLHVARGLEIVKTLLLSGAHINARDNQGCTPLSRHLSRIYYRCCISTVEVFCENGADVNIPDKAGKDALEVCRLKGYYQDMKNCLLKAKGQTVCNV